LLKCLVTIAVFILYFRFQRGRQDPFENLLTEPAARKSGTGSGGSSSAAASAQTAAKKKRSGARPNLENILEGDDEAH
jgi:hypothetical protein